MREYEVGIPFKMFVHDDLTRSVVFFIVYTP